MLKWGSLSHTEDKIRGPNTNTPNEIERWRWRGSGKKRKKIVISFRMFSYNVCILCKISCTNEMGREMMVIVVLENSPKPTKCKCNRNSWTKYMKTCGRKNNFWLCHVENVTRISVSILATHKIIQCMAIFGECKTMKVNVLNAIRIIERFISRSHEWKIFENHFE